MTQPHTIEIEINDEGEISSTVRGIQGESCADLTQWLEDLGAVVEHHRTADYYRRQRTGTPLRVLG